nr:prolyl 3-hydroxylase 2-like [Meriones unguiculatus]
MLLLRLKDYKEQAQVDSRKRQRASLPQMQERKQHHSLLPPTRDPTRITCPQGSASRSASSQAARARLAEARRQEEHVSWRRPFKRGQPAGLRRGRRARREPERGSDARCGTTGSGLGGPPRVRRRMRESTWVSLLLLLLLPAPQWGDPGEPERGPLQPFDLLYASGVAAYYGGDYERAVRDLEGALRSHRRLRDVRTRCARHCAARRPLAPPGAGPGGELPFFRALLERARCSRSCQRQRLGGPASRHRVSEDVRSDFQRRVPYNYLQRAYIKIFFYLGKYLGRHHC